MAELVYFYLTLDHVYGTLLYGTLLYGKALEQSLLFPRSPIQN